MGGLILSGAAAIWEMSKGGTQNVVPSWAAGSRPLAGESASQMVDRLCKAQYPPDGAGCGSGPDLLPELRTYANMISDSET